MDFNLIKLILKLILSIKEIILKKIKKDKAHEIHLEHQERKNLIDSDPVSYARRMFGSKTKKK